MNKITEKEFLEITAGIRKDSEIICKHNPLGTPDEILLWMLLCCLNSYLSLSEIEAPCFNRTPDAETYKSAIRFVLKNRMTEDFNVDEYLNGMLGE